MLEGFTKSLANIKANELFKGVNYEKYCFLVKKSIAFLWTVEVRLWYAKLNNEVNMDKNQESIIENNIVTALNALKEFTATPGCGVTRFPFTEEAREACAYLKKRM